MIGNKRGREEINSKKKRVERKQEEKERVQGGEEEYTVLQR